MDLLATHEESVKRRNGRAEIETEDSVPISSNNMGLTESEMSAILDVFLAT
jgi:hypothetical protein